MNIKPDQIAVITGAGSGIGRALAVQLSQAGVHLSLCDLSETALEQTRELCRAAVPGANRIHLHRADVGDEAQVLGFRDAVIEAHGTKHIELLFNNAGIGGGGSFVKTDRTEWERTFNVCWSGVYFGCRAFLPLLIASERGCLVNVSSVNGFWASLGSGVSHTAYSAAKFAVKGLTEALITDLRLHAPHVSCAVVMPGHIGTSIALNTGQVLGHGSAMEMSQDSVAAVRDRMSRSGVAVSDLPDDEIRRLLHQRALDFRDKAPTSADQAAAIILDGVRADHWRILVGEDAHRLDAMVRSDPERAYEPAFAEAWRDGKPPLV